MIYPQSIWYVFIRSRTFAARDFVPLLADINGKVIPLFTVFIARQTIYVPTLQHTFLFDRYVRGQDVSRAGRAIGIQRHYLANSFMRDPNESWVGRRPDKNGLGKKRSLRNQFVVNNVLADNLMTQIVFLLQRKL
jgi:hypothetical protein